MNNEILSIKRYSAIFLATVLVLGTFAAISPSFMLGAQAEPYYDGMDDRYDSYEPEYPSYATDEYKTKNDYYKSKDSIINHKFKCINNNINIVGADINQLPSNSLANGLAVQGLQDEDDGLDSNSLSQEGNNDGINLDKNIIDVCKSINNINILNEPEELQTCEECFREILTPDEISMFTQAGITIGTYCEQLLDVTSVREGFLRTDLEIRTGITDEDRLDNLIECFRKVGVVITPEEQSGLNAQGGVSNMDTDINTNDLQITQGTEDSTGLTALEKTTKLKQQWLELLP